MILNQSYDELAKSKSRHDNNMLFVSIISFLPDKEEANYLNMLFHLSLHTHIQFQCSPFSYGKHKVILKWWQAKVSLASICFMAFHV